MHGRAVGTTIAMLALAIICVTQASADVGEAASTNVYTEEMAVRDFSQSIGISLEDGRSAFRDSGPIVDILVEERDSEEIGAIWVTYKGGYEVHVRVPDGGGDSWIKQLEIALGRRVTRHEGGASLAALNRAVEYLSRNGLQVLYDLNTVDGYLDIEKDVSVPTEIIQAKYVRVVDQSDNVALSAPASAGQAWDNWNGTIYVPGCTVGYTASTGSVHYVMTAAHCRDGWHQARSQTALHGETSSASNYSESCTSGDRQWQRVNSTVDHLIYGYPHHVYVTLQAVAGGWYAGQPAMMSGRISGFDWGNIQNTGSPWGNYGLPAGPTADDCASTGISTTGIRVEDIAADPGDSGGPILLWYNGSFHLAAITSTNTPTTVFGPWVAHLPVPPGAHICVAVNPC
jgi:hypothetical protein